MMIDNSNLTCSNGQYNSSCDSDTSSYFYPYYCLSYHRGNKDYYDMLDFYSDMKREPGKFLPYKRKIVVAPALKRRFWRRAMVCKSGFLARKGKMRKRGKK
jgi:hypothetical protein